MDEATETLIDGLREIENDVGATVTWGGNNYPCVGGAEATDKVFGAGGLGITTDLTLIIRISLLSGVARPDDGQSALYKSVPEAAGRLLSIDHVTTFREALVILACTDPNQGA